MQSSHDIKLSARETIKKRAFAILMTAVAFIILQFFVSFMYDELSGYTDYYNQVSTIMQSYISRLQSAKTVEEIDALISQIQLPDIAGFRPRTVSFLLAIVMYLVGMLLTAGYQFHALMEARGTETRFKSMFYSFNYALKVLAIQILSALITAVGFILLIVPGIIFLFRYSMSVMVLYDDPNLGPIQCMKESARLMKGNKARYFRLVFSFILWAIASAIVTMLAGIPLLDVWLYPYFYISKGLFYSELTAGNWHASYGQPE